MNPYNILSAKAAEIGWQGGPWPLLNLRTPHRIVIFAIENHFSLAKWPPILSVASSASKFIRVYSLGAGFILLDLEVYTKRSHVTKVVSDPSSCMKVVM